MADWIKYFKNSDRTLFKQSIGKRRLIELIINNTPPKGKILEAGCGTAILSFLLADSGFNVTAMDVDEEIVNYAKTRFFSNSLDLKFVKGNIFSLSSTFKQKEFDTICHSGVLEHFSDEDIIQSLKEQRKVSKCVIFNVPNDRNKITSESFGNERLMSNKKWIHLIRNAGYESIKVYGGYDLFPIVHLFLPGVFFNRRFSFWWKWVSKHSIFKCEK